MHREFPETFDKGLMPGASADTKMTKAEYRRLLKSILKGSHSGKKLGPKEKAAGGAGGRDFYWKDVKDMSIKEATQYLTAIQSGQTPGDLQLQGLQPDSVIPDHMYGTIYG